MTLTAPGDAPRSLHDDDTGGLEARIVVASAGEQTRTLLERSGLGGGDPRPVIVVCGGADDLRDGQLLAARSVLGPAIGFAAARTGAAIVDGGTDTGVMALLGDERARHPESMPVLLGVAPGGLVQHSGAAGERRTSLEPHHTHFVLADSAEWGGETPLLAAIAEELACGAPVVMVLAGGGDGARAEMREAVARGWPLLALVGTGGLADAIAGAGSSRDSRLQRELDCGDVQSIACEDRQVLGRKLTWELHDDPALKDAWVLFATYDQLAIGMRRTFERFQNAILSLGIVATAIALLHEAAHGGLLRDTLHWAAVSAPIVVSVLVALATRRASGKRWVLLRAAAQGVKSEIYRYRTETGLYSRKSLESGEAPVGRGELLAARLAAVDGGLIQTDASGGPLTPYGGRLPPSAYGAEARDDGLSRLEATAYVAIRVADQLAYYRDKVVDLDRRRALLQFVTLAAGGAGALLAAVGLEIWIGVTTALAGAALAQLGYLQVDNTVVAYNRAATQLATLQREFRASGGAVPDLETLVTRAETVLTTELGGWVQQMTDALAQLQHEQEEAEAKADAAQDERGARP
jgi:hypothetical protein